MRIQGGNVDSYRTPECDSPTTSAVLPAKATSPAACTAPPPPLPPPSTPETEGAAWLARIGSACNGFLDAVWGVFRSLADAVVAPSRLLEQAAGSVLLVTGKSVSALQSLLHLEPAGRGLTEHERAVAQRVFGAALDLDAVELKPGHAGLYSLIESERPFVLGNTVYTKNADPLSDEDLVHELSHVLQYQRQGAAYMANSLASQALQGPLQAYDFATQVARGKGFADLGHEQQAELLGVAFQAGVIVDGKVARPFVVNGVDCTAPLRAALAGMGGAARP